MLPYFAGKGGFGACTEYEEADWRGVGTQAGDAVGGAGAGGVERVAEGWRVEEVGLVRVWKECEIMRTGEGFQSLCGDSIAFLVVVGTEL